MTAMVYYFIRTQIVRNCDIHGYESIMLQVYKKKYAQTVIIAIILEIYTAD